MASKILEILLLPFSLLYGIVVIIRNWLYDNNIILKSYTFDFPVIGVGNLSAGGTGKTPMTEYIVELLLKQGYKPGVISRGYGRKTKGFLLADENSTSAEIGDEPYQIFKKFPGAVLAVSEDRVAGIKKLLSLKPETNVIVLDDCYQHRMLKPGFLILLTDYNKPYYKDWLLPAGRLREPKSGRKRADVIIMTKSPLPLEPNRKQELTAKLQPLLYQQVYFSGINYKELVSMHGHRLNLKELKPLHILLFCGIANPEPLISFVRRYSCKLSTIIFPDHHNFDAKDMENIRHRWRDISTQDKLLITTEKDWRRLENSTQEKEIRKLPLLYLPIQLEWDLQEKLSFDKKILHYVRENTANSTIYKR